MESHNEVTLIPTDTVRLLLNELAKAQVLDVMLAIADDLEPVDGLGQIHLAYATAMAKITGKPQRAEKDDGTFHYVFPLDTGEFRMGEQDTAVQHAGHHESHDHAEGFTRGPAEPDEEPHPGFSDFGG